MEKKTWRNHLRSGFESRPINEEYKKLYEAQRIKYLNHTPDSDLARQTALIFVQLAQSADYTKRTGLPATNPDKLRWKEKKLKTLEDTIYNAPVVKIPKEDRVSFGGITTIRGTPGFDRLKKKKESGEIKERAEKARYERMISTPHPEAWEQVNIY